MSMKRADMITAAVLVVIAFWMMIGGYRMDRLEVRQIHPASIPGLVPMILGILLLICAALLFGRARAGDAGQAIDFGQAGRLIWTAVLCVGYAVVLIGNMPFHLATFLFIAAFVAVFTWGRDDGTARRLRRIAIAVLTGAIASALISALFLYGFLVRLP